MGQLKHIDSGYRRVCHVIGLANVFFLSFVLLGWVIHVVIFGTGAVMGIAVTIMLLLPIMILWAYRYQIISPIYIFSVLTIVSFAAPTIYLTATNEVPAGIETALIVFLAGFLAFCAGYIFGPRRWFKALTNYSRSQKLILPKMRTRLLVIAFPVLLVVWFNIRISYGIGIPGLSPSIPLSGLLFYCSTTVMTAFLAAYGFHAVGTKAGILIFILMLCLYAIYQSLLGWRSGVNEVLLIFLAVAILYGRHSPGVMRKLLIIGLLVIITLALIVVEIQNYVRGSEKGLFEIWVRLWGINYLTTVADYFDKLGNNPLTNNFFGAKLVEWGYSSAEYHNKVIIGDSWGKQHGNARTGFGSIFMYGGIFLVSVSYFFFGFLYKVLFALTQKRAGENLIGILLYVLSLGVLQRIIIEQFDFGVIMNMMAIFLAVIIVKMYFLRPPHLRLKFHA